MTTADIGIECDVDGCDNSVVGLKDGWEFSRGVVCQDCIDVNSEHGHWPDEDRLACRECVLEEGGEVHDCDDSPFDVLLSPGDDCPNCEYAVPITDGGSEVQRRDHLAYDGICPVCGEEFIDGFDPVEEGESYDNARVCIIEKDETANEGTMLVHLIEEGNNDG